MELVRKRYTLKYIHVRMHSTVTTMELVRKKVYTKKSNTLIIYTREDGIYIYKPIHPCHFSYSEIQSVYLVYPFIGQSNNIHFHISD